MHSQKSVSVKSASSESSEVRKRGGKNVTFVFPSEDDICNVKPKNVERRIAVLNQWRGHLHILCWYKVFWIGREELKYLVVSIFFFNATFYLLFLW